MRHAIAALLFVLAGCGPDDNTTDAKQVAPTSAVVTPSGSAQPLARQITLVAATTIEGVPQVSYVEMRGLDIQVTIVEPGKSWLVSWVVTPPLTFVAATDYPGNYDVVAAQNSVVLGIAEGTRSQIWIETVSR